MRLAELIQLALSVLCHLSVPQFRAYDLTSDELTIIPSKQGGDELQNLEFLRICAVESQKVKKVVRDELSINHIFGFPLP